MKAECFVFSSCNLPPTAYNLYVFLIPRDGNTNEHRGSVEMILKKARNVEMLEK